MLWVIGKIFESFVFLAICALSLIPAYYIAGYLHIHNHTSLVSGLGGFVVWVICVSMASSFVGLK